MKNAKEQEYVKTINVTEDIIVQIRNGEVNINVIRPNQIFKDLCVPINGCVLKDNIVNNITARDLLIVND